jgi:hypothetical protein
MGGWWTGKDGEWKQSWPILRYNTSICLKGCEQPLTLSIRIASLWGWGLKPGIYQYKADVLFTHLWTLKVRELTSTQKNQDLQEHDIHTGNQENWWWKIYFMHYVYGISINMDK